MTTILNQNFISKKISNIFLPVFFSSQRRRDVLRVCAQPVQDPWATPEAERSSGFFWGLLGARHSQEQHQVCHCTWRISDFRLFRCCKCFILINSPKSQARLRHRLRGLWRRHQSLLRLLQAQTQLTPNVSTRQLKIYLFMAERKTDFVSIF